MNANFKSHCIALLTGTLFIIFARLAMGYPNPPCIEYGPHTNAWSCYQNGSVNSSGSLNQTNLIVAVGQTVTPPGATGTTFNNGQKRRWIWHDCNTSLDYYQNAPVTYTASAIFFYPTMPAVFTNAGTYTFTAKADGIASDTCGPISGIVVGTLTVHVWATTDSDYDGVSDYQEAVDGTDPDDPNSVSPLRLAYFPFDNTNTWAGSAGQLPLQATNIIGVPSWSTNAVLIDSTNPSVMNIPSCWDGVAVGDASFETPVVGAGNYSYYWGSMGSWTIYYGGITTYGTVWGCPPPVNGSQVAVLQGGGATLSQTLTGLVVGRTYTVDYWAAVRGWQYGNDTWSVLVNGNVLASYDPGYTANFVEYRVNFVATSSSAVLTFDSTDLHGGDNTVFIDSVNVYGADDTNGNADINLRNGTIRFWFKPDWSSTNAGGVGPQSEGRLIEMGTQGTTNGWWGLVVGSAGTNIYFGTQTNSTGTLTTNLTAAISWTSNIWHQIVLTYSTNSSALYLDGQPVITNGLGVTYYPGLAIRAQGFTLGSSASGTNQARGAFDELETFNYSLNTTNAIDSDQDGLPDWWEWKYFDTFDYSATNLDSYGNTLLYDYENGYDPNPIEFSIEATNNYLNITNASVQLNIIGGTPSYMAVLVDSTNFATTNWTAFTTTNLTVNLGTTQGWHDIWVGLRGLPSDAQQSWRWKRLKLDKTSPQLALTSPTNGTVNVPMIQLTGFSLEALDHISCDLTNALGLVTNLDAGVTDQHYDTNTLEFTTNYFECLDVPLTNGVNTVIIHATDLAGNVTTSNFNFTLDYSSKTNPPVVQLTMPLNWMKVCGSSFTLRGQVDDPTVTVMASITDTNGDTNVVYGLVERNGRFWLENVPLNSGTNRLSITVSNVVGNTTVTNISLVQSALTLTMTPVSDSSQLWQPVVGVGGTISDSSDAVWVNGVKGTNNGDGTWSADNVPVTAGGVATFDVTAYPPSEAPSGTSMGTGVNPQTANAANSPANNADKPPRLYVKHYDQNLDWPYSWRFDTYDDDGNEYWWGEYHFTTAHNDYHWDNGAGGGGSILGASYGGGCYYGDCSTNSFSWWSDQLWPASTWPDMAEGTQTAGGDYDWPIFDPVIAGPGIIYEYCAINYPFKTQYQFHAGEGSSYYLEKDWWDGSYARSAHTEMRLDTGGMALSKKHTFQISGAATQLIPTNQSPWHLNLGYLSAGIAPQDITIDGKALDSSGNMYEVLADNVTRDVTPRAKKDYYTFTVGEAESCAQVMLTFGDTPARPPNSWPCDWSATLEVGCPNSLGSTNYASLASIHYGFSVDTNGIVTIQTPTGGGSPGSCGTIVVTTNGVNYPVLSGVTNHGILIAAYYIGCCDGGTLNWVQTIITSAPTGNNPTNSPYNDHSPYCDNAPYYWCKEGEPYGVDQSTFELPPNFQCQ